MLSINTIKVDGVPDMVYWFLAAFLFPMMTKQMTMMTSEIIAIH